MTISIIGTGNMALGLATRFAVGGHDVQVHAHNADHGEAMLAKIPAEAKAKVTVVSFAAPLAGDVVVLAVPYDAMKDVIEAIGSQLDGKIVIDISNPLDWSTMESVIPAGGSAAEQIAGMLPKAHVVKAFNTTFAGLLLAGTVAGRPLDVFVAGPDAARATVLELVQSSGLRGIDAGALAHARQLEGMSQMLIITHGQVAQPFSAGLNIVS
jgi:NADPH-dependent F420 reductase